ncbi:MAG: hypothetical protein M1837_006124 [Sclerophora amabilis]|nr:MAG: hypothetical protein M1837_006124 [Sclerophora amabilis]
MSLDLPYTYISCPCSDTFNSLNTPSNQLQKGNRVDQQNDGDEVEDDHDEDRMFDPRSPRSNYSLYPLDQLLYCEDCHQIRCPRCVLEEIVCFYCPSCLFEVPSSLVKSDGNRCSRNCYNCPVCTAPLSVNGLDTSPPPTADHVIPGGPWVLACSYCNWSSLEVGIQFEKPNNISGQLAKMKGSGLREAPWHEQELERDRRARSATVERPDESEKDASEGGHLDPERQFVNLKSFYTSQLLEHTSTNSSSLSLSSSSYAYGSPGTLSRIMGIYTGVGDYGRKKAKGKTDIMREAAGSKEGVKMLESEDETIKRMREGGWDAGSNTLPDSVQEICLLWDVSHIVTSLSQRTDLNGNSRFPSDLRPLPTILRTKRSKRCRTCRHILVRPESKVQSTRFRIKLLAQNYIPTLSVRPLHSTSTSTSTSTPAQLPSLAPLTPSQHLLTFTNPLFDPIRVTLATPSTTPGRFASKVTILCPQLDVGANTDVWDEALSNSTAAGGGHGSSSSSRQTSSIAATRGKSGKTATGADSTGGGGGANAGQAEAGKVWERGRNWTSVVLEVVPASLKPNNGLGLFGLSKNAQEKKEEEDPNSDEQIREDEDIIEIPVFVRVEYETEAVAGSGLGEGASASTGGGGGSGATGHRQRSEEVGGQTPTDSTAGKGKEKRELAYWSVVAVGRIVQQL